jgi:DNA-binding XRE family transcriptional regulator
MAMEFHAPMGRVRGLASYGLMGRAISLGKTHTIQALGANIRRERTARGLTQERLAELADLNPRTIQKIEAGEITILVTTLFRLRAAIGCDWKRLLG